MDLCGTRVILRRSNWTTRPTLEAASEINKGEKVKSTAASKHHCSHIDRPSLLSSDESDSTADEEIQNQDYRVTPVAKPPQSV
ncbi:hypothetical protein U1Q18_012281 [Sarracenia purpurea var. burkii]